MKITRKMRQAALKACLDANAINYRITLAGEIHFYGTMPNTNQIGWWFYGYVSEA
jgi:hypothetical protein